MFIVFEGGDGSGKSTQAQRLYEYLKSQGKDVIFTREPGGTEGAELIRQIILDKKEKTPLEEAELFAASRFLHIQNKILPALKENKIIICDRFLMSSLAYQGHAGGLGFQRVLELNKFAVENCLPDVTLFFNLPPEKKFRPDGEIHDRFEDKDLAFKKKVYEGYGLARGVLNGKVIDIYPSNNGIDATFTSILEKISPFLP